MYVDIQKIRSMDDLMKLKEHTDFGVIIVAKEWYIIGQQLERIDIKIGGIYIDEVIQSDEVMNFEQGYICRIPQNNLDNGMIYSIVVDCIK